ncbi:MAG: flagellar basal body-associated FliL family protein [Bacterioplanes sp.]|nr:flagellar basal body-associated FliL family protein [Bacterioplanes sp.]
MAAEQDLTLDDENGNTPPEGSGGKKKKLIILIIGALLLVAVAIGATWFLLSGNTDANTDEAVEAEPVLLPIQYVILKPEFVVSFQVGTRQRFLQVSLEVMTRAPHVKTVLEMHDPMIRNDIIRIMTQQPFDALRTAEGRVALQQALTAHLDQVVAREHGEGGVEAVLFTNFVMQ